MRRAGGRRVLLALLLAAAGCGVDPEQAPEEIQVSAVPDARPAPDGAAGGSEVTLFFVRGSRLEPVQRPADRVDRETALELLADGPTPAEVAAGLRTALLPQPLVPQPPATGADAVTVVVSREFTGVAGGDQMRAVAQVVFTVTELSGPEQVRFATADGPVEVPTDQGLTVVPVDRDDYASVAPVPAAAAAPVPGDAADAGPPPPAAPPAAPGSTGGRRPARVHSRPGSPA
ncbi:GerMN domain-containing protein [Geodermatophilus sp. YIM 151500]|uniref:GerMN domain-containing protein n=1 Tax=Geodermatophilus sp. YIM 151500 TaxID=2984531 RepID=UPI0021E39305|nr:GerMN domain-containing protein [Geodermatophilus sp. YIM 151500]MCV2487838.1 GerMN domain-containing protein [Geodermatophilus sp. YIM 151500]